MLGPPCCSARVCPISSQLVQLDFSAITASFPGWHEIDACSTIATGLFFTGMVGSRTSHVQGNFGCAFNPVPLTIIPPLPIRIIPFFSGEGLFIGEGQQSTNSSGGPPLSAIAFFFAR